MILTGRGVLGVEAGEWGLANRVCEPGDALDVALGLAVQLGSFPQTCLRSDRASVLEQWGLDHDDAMANEIRHGMVPIRSGETREGAARFAGGAGRHGSGVG